MSLPFGMPLSSPFACGRVQSRKLFVSSGRRPKPLRFRSSKIVHKDMPRSDLATQDPVDDGDGTVPAAAGAAGIQRARPRVTCVTRGHDHQGSYLNADVRHVVLDAIVRAVAEAKVPA